MNMGAIKNSHFVNTTHGLNVEQVDKIRKYLGYTHVIRWGYTGDYSGWVEWTFETLDECDEFEKWLEEVAPIH